MGWIEKNFGKIKKVVEKESSHIKLKKIQPFVVGNVVYLRFECDTGDAMGMNMVTIGADRACKYIASKTGAKLVAISGNVCSDKKPCALNFIMGRGKKVIADVLLKSKVLEKTLRTNAADFYDVCIKKNLLGGIVAGSIGFNAQHANVFKALFIATGQDEAHIVEGSQGITFAELRGKDVYLSITLPCVQVGTVGGGTRTETAQECLSILGVNGGGNPIGTNALKFAEIVGAAVLAGEISLIAANASNQLAQAHQKLGR